MIDLKNKIRSSIIKMKPWLIKWLKGEDFDFCQRARLDKLTRRFSVA